jgi:hypothetical protein
MNNAFRKKLIIRLFIVILIIIILLAVYLLKDRIILLTNSVSKERFASANEQILADDLKDDQDFHKCINENDQLIYSSNGRYSNCEQTLNQLSTSGVNPNSDIGYGKMTDICPVTALLSSPSACLVPRLNSQEKIIERTQKAFNDSPKNIEVSKIFNKLHLNAYKKNLDTLYSDNEIIDTVKYIKTNRFKTSNDPYESTINNIVNPSPTPTPDNSIELSEQDIELAKFKLGS